MHISIREQSQLISKTELMILSANSSKFFAVELETDALVTQDKSTTRHVGLIEGNYDGDES